MITDKLEHIKSLDSLRGIAAIMVFINHLFYINLGYEQYLKPWFLFKAGHEGVILFFVLSGFVLSVSNSKTNYSYFQYCIKRIFRIYPAYYVSIVFSIVLFVIIRPSPISEYTDIFNAQFPSIVINKGVILNAIILVTSVSSKINSVVWSLAYEVIISLFLLPLFWKINNKKNIVFLFIALCFIYVILPYIHYSANKNVMILLKLIRMNTYYSLFFFLGMILYKSHDKLMCLSKWYLFPIYVILYASIYFSFGSEFIKSNESLRDMLTALGSMGFIIISIHNINIRNILSKSIFHFFGRISFSFYLLHMPFLYLIVYTCRTFMNVYVMWVFIFILTTIFSYISYCFIEVKFMNYSKKLIKI